VRIIFALLIRMWNPMPKLCLLLAGKKKSPFFLLFQGINLPMVDFLSERKPALIPSFSFHR